MKNNLLARKVKELRIQTGSSQEQLADKTQLNLRTIQRIENGETEPRGDSLKRLAWALGVATEELTGLMEPADHPSAGGNNHPQKGQREELREDRGFLAVLHLSALGFLLFPLFWMPGLGILGPLILWLLKKDQIGGVRAAGRKILNFQASWLLAFIVVYGAVFLARMLHRALPFDKSRFLLILAVLYLYNLLTIFRNVVRALKSQPADYQPAIPFLPQ